jgi:hypothetical protein
MLRSELGRQSFEETIYVFPKLVSSPRY